MADEKHCPKCGTPMVIVWKGINRWLRCENTYCGYEVQWKMTAAESRNWSANGG